MSRALWFVAGKVATAVGGILFATTAAVAIAGEWVEAQKYHSKQR